jgi:hypothetical protein
MPIQPGDVAIQATVAIKNAAPAPIARNEDIKGGWKVVASIVARDAIPSYIREVGMVAYVIATDEHYRLVGGIANTDWQLAAFGGGGVSWQVDSFVATDGQTVFVLSQTPTQPSFVFLLINFVPYSGTAFFTVSGTTVTWLNLFTIQASDDVRAFYGV